MVFLIVFYVQPKGAYCSTLLARNTRRKKKTKKHGFDKGLFKILISFNKTKIIFLFQFVLKICLIIVNFCLNFVSDLFSFYLNCSLLVKIFDFKTAVCAAWLRIGQPFISLNLLEKKMNFLFTKKYLQFLI